MREIPIHSPCFGRADDLDHLAARIENRGVTFVMAPPRIGKTWLVRNLAFDRAQGWNIGYAESSSGKNDLMREAVADLYKRWLDGAGAVAQAHSLWERHKDGLVGKVGGAVGKMLGKIAALADGDIVGADKVIDETFNALTAAEKDLRSGGLILAPITYEDARDLVRTLAIVTGKPILLVMDAWERGGNLAPDRGSIQKLLDNEDDWPDAFHLLVVIRDMPKHLDEVRFADECCNTYPSAAHHQPGRLALGDLAEQDRLLLFLREKVPAVANADRDWVIEQCANPAVIEWWVRRKPADQKALITEAGNARDSQHKVLFDLIDQIHDQPRLFAAVVRLAMLPEITSSTAWKPYREIVDADDPDAVVADLQSRRILYSDQPEYPSFGHATDHDAVRAFLLRAPANRSQHDPRPHVRVALKELIRDLARRVQSAASEVAPFVDALSITSDTVGAAGLDHPWQWPGSLARTLLDIRLSPDERAKLLQGTWAIDVELPEARTLLAMGLLNTLNDAKDEEDLARRDVLLAELRALSEAHPEDAAVREQLAMGLFNTLIDAKDEEDRSPRDALLAELRTLSKAHPEDAAVRELLANGLAFVAIWLGGEGDTLGREKLLAELRNLLDRHADDDRLTQVREWLDDQDGQEE